MMALPTMLQHRLGEGVIVLEKMHTKKPSTIREL